MGRGARAFYWGTCPPRSAHLGRPKQSLRPDWARLGGQPMDGAHARRFSRNVRQRTEATGGAASVPDVPGSFEEVLDFVPGLMGR